MEYQLTIRGEQINVLNNYMIKDTLKQIEEYRKLFFIETGSQILKIGTEEFEKNIKEEYLQAGFRVAKSLIIKVLEQLVERENRLKDRLIS